jgi:hypothetical protein
MIIQWMMYKKAIYQIAAQIADEMMLLQNDITPHSSASPDHNTEQNKILHFTLPVSQIAILLRLLVDGGVIKAQNQTDFLKRVAMIIQTNYATVISAESFRNKYYAPERNNLITVKDILFNLIKQMKRLE